MGISNKIAQIRAYKNGVRHCTFDPGGPGVVRIHLVPPRPRLFSSAPHIVILNGYYLLPVGYSVAIMLSYFIDEINKYDGKELSDEAVNEAFDKTVRRASAVYPGVDREYMKEDLQELLDILFTVARGASPEIEIEKLSIRSYSENMYAPHRMDLMVSAMTDGCGNWKCNQRCMFCYAAGQMKASSPELSTQEWKSAIDKLKRAGVPMLTFTGGEPTEREDLAELVGYAKWFVTRLNTNGIRLSEKLCADLKEAGLDSVQVTFYSADSDIHNTLVGGEHHAQTVTGIKNAVSAGLDISVNTPLCTLNRDYIKTLELIHSLGVRFVTLSGLITTGAAEDKSEKYDLSPSELYTIVSEAKSFCDSHGVEMDFTSPGLIEAPLLEKIGVKVPSCGAALSNMAIAPDGTVVPCQSWLGSGSSLGNILKDSFASIWEAELCRTLRAMNAEEALACPFRGRKGGRSCG